MPQRSKFQAPRVVQDFPTVQRALREVQESLDAATGSRAQLKLHTSDFSLVAGCFHRASAQSTGGIQVRLPAASGENLGSAITISLEGMRGPLTVYAAPGQTVNGAATATFSTDGIVVFWSNGVRTWTSTAELPAESPGGAALDAEYVLGAAHASLPNGRVATDSAEVDADLATPGLVSWALNLASVGFDKLANLTGLSVLGRAANSAGVMAAITATANRQVLRVNDAGTALQWGDPVAISDSGVFQGDVYELNFVAGTNVNVAASVVAGVATITPSVDLSSVTYTAGDGIDLVGNQFSADVSDFAGTGLEDDGSNNLRIAATAAGAGLTGGGGSALAVGAGNFITVNANDVAVNLTTLVPAIDSTSVVANGTVLERAAITGAVALAQNANTSTFAGIRFNGAATTDRSNLNFINSSTLTAVLIDDAGNDEIEVAFTWNGLPVLDDGVSAGTATSLDFTSTTSVTASVTGAPLGVVQLQRAALTGAIAASTNSNATTFAGIRDNGSAENDRTNLNFVNGTNTTATVTDDAGNDELEIRFNVDNFPLSGLADVTTDTFLANVTGVNAPPSALTLSTLGGAGLSFNALTKGLDVDVVADGHLTTTSPSGTQGSLRFRKSRARDCWWEDFDFLPFGRTSATITTAGLEFTCGCTNWYLQGTGLSGNVITVAPIDNHPGIVRIGTGTTSGNGMILYRGVGDTGGTLSNSTLAQDIFMAEAILRVPTVTNVLWEFGFRDNAGANYIEFYGDTAVGTTIHSYTEEASATTDTDTGTTFAANAWNVYTMVQESAGTFDFYVDDVLETTHSTNVPDGEGVCLFFNVLTRTAATRQLDIDYVSYESQNLGGRTS
jgi:hypothetical protein